MCLDPHVNVDYNSSVSWTQLLRRHSIVTDDITAAMTSAGRWRPLWCIPRHRIALVVPFSSDREAHLLMFLNNIHPFLRRQLIDYTIIVVEQVPALL